MEVVLKPAFPHLSNPGNGSEHQALFQKAEPPERESWRNWLRSGIWEKLAIAEVAAEPLFAW
ncbi:MAG: hypothetical protein BRC44_08400 [Cyanobacteria bacterium QS_4_48_99]|nr:MAG: hypothetical protein BRC44_08400 [Cyanobacteria bacterium QS_4_48_99]